MNEGLSRTGWWKKFLGEAYILIYFGARSVVGGGFPFLQFGSQTIFLAFIQAIRF